MTLKERHWQYKCHCELQLTLHFYFSFSQNERDDSKIFIKNICDLLVLLLNGEKRTCLKSRLSQENLKKKKICLLLHANITCYFKCKRCFCDTIVLYVCRDTSQKPPDESILAILKRFFKIPPFNYQFFCAILRVMEIQPVSFLEHKKDTSTQVHNVTWVRMMWLKGLFFWGGGTEECPWNRSRAETKVDLS